jgi:xylan 1,4-beta-xylosidase
MNMGQQLRGIGNSMEVVASFPELRKTPIIIGESDPDGCAACRAREYPQYGYRNGSLFASYTAASFARKHELAERHGVRLEGALTWSFTFEDQPLFAGMRSLATGGIDKPVLNVFRMFSRMGGRRLPATSDQASTLDQILREGVRGKPDVSALASLDGRRLAVLVWHYHDDDLPGDDARVDLVVTGLPAATTAARLEHFRIDDDHSNAFTVWKRMGRPEKPSPEQYAELEKAGRLARAGEPESVTVKGGEAAVRFVLPRQGVSLLVFELGGSGQREEGHRDR